jgi:hypothetical protein
MMVPHRTRVIGRCRQVGHHIPPVLPPAVVDRTQNVKRRQRPVNETCQGVQLRRFAANQSHHWSVSCPPKRHVLQGCNSKATCGINTAERGDSRAPARDVRPRKRFLTSYEVRRRLRPPDPVQSGDTSLFRRAVQSSRRARGDPVARSSEDAVTLGPRSWFERLSLDEPRVELRCHRLEPETPSSPAGEAQLGERYGSWIRSDLWIEA